MTRKSVKAVKARKGEKYGERKKKRFAKVPGE